MADDPELRLTQRNDGRGIRAAARLDVQGQVQAGSSTQQPQAPRVGGKGQYS